MKKPDLISRIQAFYENSKTYIAYTLLTVAIALLLGRDFFDAVGLGDFANKLLPVSLASAFVIVIETLFSIHQAVSPKYERLNFGSLGEAVPHMLQAIKSKRSKNTQIRMILGTAATTMVSVLPPLIRESSDNVKISMQLADPDSNQVEYLPEHWVPTIRANLKRIGGEVRRTDPKRRLAIEIWTFSYTPWINAFLINDEHLYMTTYKWEAMDKSNKISKITIANCPYLYFKHTSENAYYFDMFDEWFYNAPKKIYKDTESPTN